MRALFFFIVAVSLSSMLTACGGSATTTSTTTTTTSSEDDTSTMTGSDRSLLEAAGGDAAATIVLYPGHWTTFGGNLLRMGGALVPELRPILSASALWPALQALGADEDITLPRALEGWDDQRPLVLALFESPALSVPDLLARADEERPVSPVTHRLIIPATDPAALKQALVEIAQSVGCAHSPADLEGLPEDETSILCGMRYVAVLEPGAHLVRVRVAEIHDGRVPPTLAEPPSSPVIVTPALRWIFEGPVVAAAHFRPARVRAAALLFVADEVASAVTVGGDDADRARYAARAKVDLMGAVLRTSPVGAEVDDVSIGMMTGNRPTLAAVQGLTEVGVAAYEAGRGAPVAPEGPPEAPLVIRSAVNVDVMQAVAGVPLGLGGIRSSDAALERVEECGAPCYLHMLTSRVFGLGALSDQTGLLRELESDAGPFFRFEAAELDEGVTMELALDFPRLATRLGNDRDVIELATLIGRVEGVQVRQGRTVMTTVRMGSAPPRQEIARFAANDPGPRDDAGPRDEGAACAEAILVDLEAAALHGASRLPARAAAVDSNACPEAPSELRALIDAWSGVAGSMR